MIRIASAALLATLFAGTAMAETKLKAGQFADEASAAAHCPKDTVIWAAMPQKSIHMADDKYYGKTKKGAYMCEKDALIAGYRAKKPKQASTKG